MMHFFKHCLCHGQNNEPYNQEIKTPTLKCSFWLNSHMVYKIKLFLKLVF